MPRHWDGHAQRRCVGLRVRRLRVRSVVTRTTWRHVTTASFSDNPTFFSRIDLESLARYVPRVMLYGVGRADAKGRTDHG
jgi:hypothetical protein